MKRHLAAAFALAAIIGSPVTASASDWKSMTILDLAKTPPPANIKAIWADAIDASNKAFVQKYRPITSKTGISPILIATHQFAVNGGQIIATVFHGNQPECDSGANSSASDQSWADCPARVTYVTDSGKTTTLNTKACFNSFPMGENIPAPAGDKTLVSYDPAQKRVLFRVSAAGTNVQECNRSVKLPD